MNYPPPDVTMNLAFASSPRTPNGAADLLDDSPGSDDLEGFDIDDLSLEDDSDEDYDGVSVSDCEADENEINLAHRTSEIMNDYRAYLTEVAGAQFSSTSGGFNPRSLYSSNESDGDEDDDVEEGYVNFASQEHGEHPNVVIGTGDQQLQRVWAYKGDFHDVPVGTSSLQGSNGSDSPAYDRANVWVESIGQSRRYKNYKQAFRSKKMKRGVMGVIVACAFIGIIAGITNSTMNSSKSTRTEEDFEALMAVAIEEEKEREDALPHKGVAAQPHKDVASLPHKEVVVPQAIVLSTQSKEPIKQENEYLQIPPKFSSKEKKENVPKNDVSDTEDLASKKEVATEPVVQINQVEEITSEFQLPITVSEAPASKSAKTTKEGNQSHTLAMFETQEKEWMEHYEAVVIKYKPRWYDRSRGWNGRNYIDALTFCAAEEQDFIPCPYEAYCPSGPLTTPVGGFKNEEQDGSWAPIMDSPNGWVQVSSKNPCVRYDTLHNYPPEWGLTGQDNEEFTRHLMCCKDPSKDSNEDTSGSLEAVKSSMEIHLNTDKEQVILDELHPVWFGREQGYKGTTHNDAVKFCNNVAGMELCPIEAYCPNGKGQNQDKSLFLDKSPFQGEQWAPINTYSGDSTYENDWVFIGSVDGDTANTCLSHRQINNKGPIWGIDGSKTEIKEHVMCCSDSSHFVAETKYMEKLNPQWLEWDGASHTEAVAECANIGKKICPYAAYCPHGPGKPAAGYHYGDFATEGEQWAPVNDNGRGTHWIQIGQKHGNALTTCLSSNELEGQTLDGGISNKGKQFMKHLMCCDL